MCLFYKKKSSCESAISTVVPRHLVPPLLHQVRSSDTPAEGLVQVDPDLWLHFMPVISQQSAPQICRCCVPIVI